MKKIFTFLLLLVSYISYPQSTTLVISQAYGGGGNTGAPYNADFVELHNISAATQSLSGLSVQYSAATNTGAWTGIFALPAASIPPGGYYLIKMSAVGTAGVALPVPDASTPSGNEIAMSSSNGRVALVTGVTALTGCPTANVIDLVGFGTSNCFEGTVIPALSNTTAALRKTNGCTETNNNNNDFTVAAPAPRNSATAVVSCGSSTSPSLTVSGSIANFGNITVGANSTAQTFNLFGTNLTGAPGNITITAPSTDFQVSNNNTTWSATTTIAYTGATLAATPVYVRFTPQTAGVKSGNIVITGGGVSTAVTVAVAGTGVVAANPSLTVTGTITDFGSVAVLTNSPSQTFNLSGSNLTGAPGNITITAPSTDFEVSNNNTTWGATTTIAYTSATLASTPVYVRFTPQTTGLKTGNVAITGGGVAATVNVAVSGTGVSAASSIITASALTAFGSICLNTTATNSFTVTGNNLTTEDVTIAALNGFTYSTASTGTFTPTLSVPQPGGSFSQVIYVKFSPVAAQSYNGNIAVTGGGVTTAVNVAASGTGINTTATVATGAPSAITITSATVAGTISATGCSALSAYGVVYSTVNNFPAAGATQVASANLSSNAYTVSLTGLTGATTYYYRAFATNAGGTVYGAQMSFTTSTPPPATLTATALAGFGAGCVNTTAGPNSFTIAGNNLTAANVSVGPLNGYSFSTSATGTYTASLSIPQAGGSFSQVIYVKFTPAAAASFNGNIPVGGAGAATVSVAVTGSGANTPATLTASAAANVGMSGATLSGAVTSNGCSAVTETGFVYSSIAGFAANTGTKIVSTVAGTTFSAQVGSLLPNTTYYFRSYAVSSSGAGYSAEQSFITAALPQGLVIYSTPGVRGSALRYSLSSIKRGHYATALYNMAGQKVFKKDILIQVNYVNDGFIIPSTLPAGVYILQIENYEFKVRRQLIIR